MLTAGGWEGSALKGDRDFKKWAQQSRHGEQPVQKLEGRKCNENIGKQLVGHFGRHRKYEGEWRIIKHFSANISTEYLRIFLFHSRMQMRNTSLDPRVPNHLNRIQLDIPKLYPNRYLQLSVSLHSQSYLSEPSQDSELEGEQTVIMAPFLDLLGTCLSIVPLSSLTVALWLDFPSPRKPKFW